VDEFLASSIPTVKPSPDYGMDVVRSGL